MKSIPMKTSLWRLRKRGLSTLVFLACFSSTLFAQITIDLKDLSIKNAIKIIEKNYPYKFFYNENLVGLNKSVSFQVNNASLEKTMSLLLKDTEITYRLENNTIVLLNKETSKKKIRKVSGNIQDINGEPIIGASIIVAETSEGTITDYDGNFSLDNLDLNTALKISYIGYQAKEFVVKNESDIKITLLEDTKMIEEVVVVGYGSQKKVNLTGSVVSVGGKALEARPISNVASGLQGSLPGVTIINSTSRPGDNNVSIRIRGIGTLNNSNPLILIDGVEGNMNTLNPDDIESVSVLKDAASSSIYGSRAANGVILVTTKKASKDVKTTVNYSGYFALQTPTAKPEVLDAVQYLTLLKEATSNVKKGWGYTQEDVDAVLNGTNPNYRANTNWIDEIYKPYAPQQGHNVSLNGGSKSLGYYMSYGYLSTSGLAVGDAYHSARNNIRMKVNSELFDRINLEGNFSYSELDNWTPTSSDSGDGGLFYQALRSSPLVPVRFTDNQWGYGGSSANPLAIATDGGFTNYRSQQTTLNMNAEVRIINGLSAKIQYATRLENILRKNQRNIIQHFQPGTQIPLAFSSNTSYFAQRDVAQRYQNLMAQADYEKEFNKHSIHLMAGFSQEWQLNQVMNAKREDLVSESLPVIDAGTNNQTNDGSDTHWAIRSGFGRLNYNYSDRYLAEFNIRYDLSSRFHKNNRAGCFPSASFAWRISEEKFMENTKEWLDNLKFRISYGTLGNQYTASLYPYMSTIESSFGGMPIGGEITSSMQQNSASNNRLTWETIHMSNIGLDYGMFNNRLILTADYFIKNTDGILLKVKLPDVLGVSEPYQNAGKVQNKGWELSLAWQDNIGKDFKYGVNFSLSDVKNKVVSVGNTADDFSGNQIRAVGYPIDSFWGYVADGLYSIDDFEYQVGNNTYILKEGVPVIAEYKSKVQPGDIKYKDLDGKDGITAVGDRTYLGSPIPRFTYTIGLNGSWKNIDFQAMIQGVGKCDGFINGTGRHAFMDIANYPQKEHLNRWTLNNPNENASYPRFTYNENYNQNTFSSFWLEDASYMRLKNIQVGYSIPTKGFLRKIFIDKCRFYFSGENLLTISDFFSSYDPEVPVSEGGYYPVTASYSFGLSVTFR